VHIFVRVWVFWPRRSRGLKIGQDKRHFLAEVHIKFFRLQHELQSKKHHWQIINLFCIYLFQIDKFINIYETFFFIVIVSSLPIKLEIYYIFAIQLFIYIIYGDRTIVGVVGFVANLLNRSTDGATVNVRKSTSEKELSFVRF
jgi:hypothetical protein